MSSDRPTQYSSADRKRHITLTMDNGGHGSMLTEVVRAYLHTGVPSIMVKNLIKGVRHFKSEVEGDADHNDKLLLEETEKELIQLFGRLNAREKELYETAAVEPSSTPVVALAPPMSAPLAPLARPFTPGGSFQRATVRDVPRAKLALERE